jgi:hypothetical protein
VRPALVVILILTALVSVSGCRPSGDSGEPKVVLTTADVQKAFEDQGLNLEAFTVSWGIPAARYPAGERAEPLVTCLMFDLPAIARVYVITIRAKSSKNVSRAVSRALRAKNVAVLLDPAATPDDVQRTLRAVVELRHE